MITIIYFIVYLVWRKNMKLFLINIIIIFSLIPITLKAVWERVDTGMCIQQDYRYQIYTGAHAVGIDHEMIVVGARELLFISYDNGDKDSWKYLLETTYDYGGQFTSICIKDNWIFAVTDGKFIYRSFDYGLTWNKLLLYYSNEKGDSSYGSDYTCIEYIDDALYVGFASTHGVYKSIDFGNSWVPITKNIGRKFLSTINSILKHNNKLFISIWGHGIFSTTDNGSTWINDTNGLNLNLYTREIWLSRNYNSNILSACIYESSSKGSFRNFFIFDDNINKWRQIYSTKGNLPELKRFQFPFLCYENYIFIAVTGSLDTGVIYSNDYGKTWLKYNHGLDYIIEYIKRSKVVSNVFWSFNANNKYLFLGIGEGPGRVLYRAPLSDFGITSAEEKSIKLESFSISPNPAEEYIEIAFSNPRLKLWVAGVDAIKIFNLLGECVMSAGGAGGTHPLIPSREGKIRIDVSGLPAGVFFVRIGDWVGRFVKI
jgi:hypothetical protein